MHNFKELKIWQKTMEITEQVYKVTKSFPKDEMYGLSHQLRRAAVSIPSNISEGAGRGSNQDFSRFLDIANGSINEVETQIILAQRLGYIAVKDFVDQISSDLDSIQKMIYSFQKSLNAK